MTTAARPTFEPARGGTGKGENDLTVLSKQYSSRDLPSHTKLKVRQPGQGKVDEIKGRDFRRELEEKERTATRDKQSTNNRDHMPPSTKKPRSEEHQPTIAELDADDVFDDDDDDDVDVSIPTEDDTAELMAELNRIKRERAVEQKKVEEEKKADEERVRMENVMSANPLLNENSNFSVKRRWDDEVVFKNCARGEEDARNKEKSFINDTLRSGFHRRFMGKYIR
ncbi:expressed hypothetical protein [Trichoplax adhaerens]|uniref:Cwf15/Cwc15 cell cycle control protein n=1 Tax=Trichoplax adhaerens TaxID=10228 RepID=B3RTY2_TRIAD|nr:expressed hypothetical protein [Trichoplax adhaerens]EDV25706.1 expressed hypothetical protein [Trichoplax adhaerens]|eukprot:XP_002111739.1 expressed hypothetical protein [Trichoplax adhaerens]